MIFNPILQEYAHADLYDVESLNDSAGNLVIVLSLEDGTLITLSSDNYFMFRKMDEGSALSTLSAMRKLGILGRSFYEVTDSALLANFIQEGYEVRDNLMLKHFLISSIDDIIDIIAVEPPVVTVTVRSSSIEGPSVDMKDF